MRIIVMGAGGVGGYFGVRLLQAGEDVSFIARGSHLAAMQKRGLQLRSSAGDALVPVRASDDAASLGIADVVLFAVKLWDTESAAAQLKPVIGPSTVVIPFQNGVESIERIARVLGTHYVAGGVARIFAVISEPGVIVHTGTLASIGYGAVQSDQYDVLKAFDEGCAKAGFEHELVSDITLAIWQKFVFLSSVSGATSVTRQTIGVVREDPDMRAMLRAALIEAFQVGKARGIPLESQFVDQQLELIDALAWDSKSSLLNDLEAGRRLEVGWLSGALARMAEEKGMSAPVHATIFASLKAYSEGARG